MGIKLLLSIYSCFFLAIVTFAQQDVPAQGSVPLISSLQTFQPNQGKITIHQSHHIYNLLEEQIQRNASRPGMQGFRIRIFFDLGQDAGSRSLEVANQFKEEYPGIPVYRTMELDSPYFKVSVGDFRSRDEALRLHKRLQRRYDKAFIVPEWINFPSIHQ